MLALDEVGLATRATKNLDIVLCVEALDAGFSSAFWAFVESGGYQTREYISGKKHFYRFNKPSDERHPGLLRFGRHVIRCREVA